MEEVDTRLSYSSATLLSNCQQRYTHYKVDKTPKDEDFKEDYEAFNIGKAFHRVLELTKHTATNLGVEIVDACEIFNVVQHKAMIHAMLLKYLWAHNNSQLKVRNVELQLSNKMFLGFVDLILEDDDGGWWISDLKTAGRDDPYLIPKLINDTQLNLYSHYAEKLGLGLAPHKFMGCRYRVTTKSTLKRGKGETYSDYVTRMMERITSRDIAIPKTVLKPKDTADRHAKLHALSLKLRKGTLKPTRNYSYCFNYFRPCPYYSHCYGYTVTDARTLLGGY